MYTHYNLFVTSIPTILSIVELMPWSDFGELIMYNIPNTGLGTIKLDKTYGTVIMKPATLQNTLLIIGGRS